jgi:hypothetical protein
MQLMLLVSVPLKQELITRARTEQSLEYRKRNMMFWFVFLTYMPGVALIGVGPNLIRTLPGVTKGWQYARDAL